MIFFVNDFKVNSAELDKSSMKNSDNSFVSPLDSLYGKNAKPSLQTGRGYGVQKYKIPKKTAPKVVESSSTEEPPPPVSSLTVCEEPVKEVATENDRNGGNDKETEEAVDELPVISRNDLEKYIKKALPSSHAEKLLEKMRQMEDDKVTEESGPEKSTIVSDTSSDQTKLIGKSNSSGGADVVDVVDATVTSSGDALLNNEEANKSDESEALNTSSRQDTTLYSLTFIHIMVLL